MVLSQTYDRQKSQCFARFKVSLADLEKISTNQFTLFDFITNSFLFSPTKKQLSVRVLDAVAARPQSFPDLVVGLKAKKSTLYLLCLSLERSGFLSKGADKRYSISKAFSKSLRLYAEWWEKWVSQAEASSMKQQ